MISDKIKRFFKQTRLQTFTFYIPAPPHRKSGYQEKEFDHALFEILKQGYELVEIQSQVNPSKEAPGIWIICTLKTTKSFSEKIPEFSFSKEIKLNEECIIVHD